MMKNLSLPNSWASCEIEDILEAQSDGKLIHQGWSPQCEKEPAGLDEWGVLKTTAIQDGLFLEHENKRLPESKEPKTRIEVKNGDLLVTNAGPRSRCGVICFVRSTRNKLMISGKMYRLRFPEGLICPEYIESWLRTSFAQKALNERKTGISESGLNMTQAKFKTLPIVVAPFAEQKAITEKLDTLLAQVEVTKARLENTLETLKQFRQSVLAAAVSGNLTKDYNFASNDYFKKINNEISSNRKLSRISALSNEEVELAQLLFNSKFKKEWIFYALEQLVDETRGIPYGIVQTGDAQEKGVPTIRCGDVKSLSIDSGQLKLVHPEIEEKYSRTRLIGGEVILAIRGTVGNASVVPKELAEHGLNISREVAMIPIRPSVNADFIALLLQSPGGYRALAEKTKGVAQRGINLADVKRFVTPLPPLDEQNEIVRRVERLFAGADATELQVNQALERVNHLTQSILAKAFRGELTEQWRKENPELISGDNSAEALLKKIKAERAAAKPKRKTRTTNA